MTLYIYVLQIKLFEKNFHTYTGKLSFLFLFSINPNDDTFLSVKVGPDITL